MTGDEDDYEWFEVRTDGGEVVSRYAICVHLPKRVFPVETGGEIVAHLCINCDTQLP